MPGVCLEQEPFIWIQKLFLSQLNIQILLVCWELKVFYIFEVNRSTFGVWLLYLVKNQACLICN